MFSRFTTKYLFAGLALFCAGPSLFASTPAATFAELDGRPGLELVRAPKFSALRFALEARDLDQDSDLDIVLRNRITRQELAWWRNDGSGNLSLGDQVKLYRPKSPPRQTLQSIVPAARESSSTGQHFHSFFTPSVRYIQAPPAAPHVVIPAAPVLGFASHTPPLRGPPTSLLFA